MKNSSFNLKFYSNFLLFSGISGLILTYSFFNAASFGGFYGPTTSFHPPINYSLILYFLFNSLMIIISSILLKNRNKIGIVLMIIGTLSIISSIFLKNPDSFSWSIKDNLFMRIVPASFVYGATPLVGIFKQNLINSDYFGLIFIVLSFILTGMFFIGIIINLIKIKSWIKYLAQNK